MTTYYTEDHEWVTVEGDMATVGITKHAADELGEVVFIDLKEAGDKFEKGDDIGVIESVKAASEIYAPIDGEIADANTVLGENPGMLNDKPESDAWIYKIKISDSSQLEGLMNLDAYKALIS